MLLVVTESFSPRPHVLQWARQRIGLSPAEAADRLGGISETELRQIEQGNTKPSITLIRRMSSVYHIQLLTLLMPDIPQGEPTLPTDFRTVRGAAPELGPETITAIYDAMERQSLLEELIAEHPELGANRELPLASADEDFGPLSSRERDRLEVTIEEQLDWSDPDEALNFWRTRVEEQGIFVFSGRLAREDCHGFSFGSESLAPVIYLNDNELPQAQIFTLFHEYAHLMLRDAALCLEREETDRGATERFCNKFSASLLMPSEAVSRAIERARARPERDGWSMDSVGQVARRLKVSRPALILRLRDLGHNVEGLYEQAVAEWEVGSWRDTRGVRGGFAPYHFRLAKSLGTRYINIVLAAHTRGTLTAVQACELLGTRRVHFENLATHASRRMERFGRPAR